MTQKENWLNHAFCRFLKPDTNRIKIHIIACMAFMCTVIQTGPASSNEPLWTSTVPLDGDRHLLMVVDPTRQVLAVYHVDAVSGTVRLRSTRALAYDLQLEEFNAVDPTPQAMKKMLQFGTPPVSSPITIVPQSPADPAGR